MESNARLQFSPFFSKMLLAFALLMAGIGVKRVAESFEPSAIYQKDFVSGYLLAKAMQAGLDPYQPLPALAQRFTPATQMENLPHPTPHTIAIGWLCYPFAWLPYERAALAWLFFELMCLALAVALLLHNLELPVTLRHGAFGMVLGLAWMPVIDDLGLGQFSVFLLVLWLLTWRDLRSRHEARAGLWLGIMIVTKLVGWPIVIWLAWRRRWRGVMAAIATTTLLQLLAVALHGWTTVRDYYVKVGPLVSGIYRTHDANYSLWTFGARLFAPFGTNFATTPLWPASGLVTWVGLALPGLALAIGLWRISRTSNDDLAFVFLACLSLLLNPIAWTHYLMTTSLGIGLFLRRLQQLGWPRVWAYRLFWLVVPLSVAQTTWALLAVRLTAEGVGADGRAFIPFWSSWLTIVPALAVMSLGWMLLNLHDQPQPVSVAAHQRFKTVPVEAPAS